jgi:WD40 repeat protein
VCGCNLLTLALCFALLGRPPAWGNAKTMPAKDADQKADPLVVAELGGAKWHLEPEFSPDGAWLLTAGTEEDARGRCVVTKWDYRNRKVLAKFPIDTVRLSEPAIAPSGRSFAVCDPKGVVFVCDSTTGKVLFSYEQWEGRGGNVKLLTFLDDDHVLSADWHSVGQKRNIRDNRTWIYRTGGGTFGMPCAAISRRKEPLVYLTERALCVLSKDLRKEVAIIKHELKDVSRLCVTDDGLYALASDGNTGLALFDLKGEKLVRRWQGHDSGKGEGIVNGTLGMVALPGRHVFATSDLLGYVRFWDAKGQRLAEVRRYPWLVSTLAVSPDNRLLATGGARQPVVLWDLEKILSGNKVNKDKTK